MEIATRTKQRDGFKIFLRLLYAVSLIIYTYFLLDGLGYYVTDIIERPRHDGYRALRPAGFYGQGFGVIGTAMMLLMLLYTARKRFRFMQSWGSLSRWLDIHIYLGVMGPLFIILHSTFKLNGLIAISFWAMIIVALSGFLGRYLYLQIPRTSKGRELDLREIYDLEADLTESLGNELGAARYDIEQRLAAFSNRFSQEKSTVGLLYSMVIADLMRPLQVRKIKRYYETELQLSGADLHRAVFLARRKVKLERQVLLLNKIQQLFHYWHVLHKPFALLMYVIMFLHIGVAIWLGYTWIL